MATLLGDEWSWVCTTVSILSSPRRSNSCSAQFIFQVGVGRDDGVAAGEFSPIFWKTSGPLVVFSICLVNSNIPSYISPPSDPSSISSPTILSGSRTYHNSLHPLHLHHIPT